MEINSTKYMNSPAIKKMYPFEIPYDAKVSPRSTQLDINLIPLYGYLERQLSSEDVLDNSFIREILAVKR